VWWALEDLWLRLSALGLLSVEQDGNGVSVVVHRLRAAQACTAGELRSVALDAETYQSREGGRISAFVRTLEFRGEDLVCELATPQAIARWPEGEELALQVQGFVARLAAMTRPTRGGRAGP
jgi:hypothetical protein